MTTPSIGGPLGSVRLSRWEFPTLVGLWFAGLLGLYGIYGLITFLRLGNRFHDFPGADRVIMVLGPSMMALALLVSVATFAASVMRFDLLTENLGFRRIHWVQLALFGVTASALAAFGPPIVRSMLPGSSDLPPETIVPVPGTLSSLRTLSAIPFGLFAVVLGAIGALVGQRTSRSVLAYATTVPWLACFGLVGAYVMSFLATANLIAQQGLPPVWIIVAPISAPLLVIAVLACREYYDNRVLFRDLRGKAIPGSLEPDNVDEILSEVFDPRHLEEDKRAVPVGTGKDDLAGFVRGMRRVAGSRAKLSDAQVSAVVAHLVKEGKERASRVVYERTSRRKVVGESAAACVSLTLGYSLIGWLGGLVPSIRSAFIVGIVGSASLFFFLRGRSARVVPQ